MDFIENNKYTNTPNDLGRYMEMKQKMRWPEILGWTIIIIAGILLILRILEII